MKTYYHGTSADNLQSILKYGLVGNENKLWNCSQDGIYLWDVAGVAESNGRDLIEDADYIEQECFQAASESGQFACSIAKDCRIVVLKIELNENEVETDYSCNNMDSRGAKVIFRDIELHEIKEINISCDLSLIKGYFMSLAIQNDYSNLEFDNIETLVANAFTKAEIPLEDIEEIINFEKLEINQLQTS